MIESEIEALFKVDPSPDFVPRLRTRVAEAPSPSIWTFRKLYIGGAAMAFAVTLALMVFKSDESKRLERSAPESASIEASTSETPGVAAVAEPETVPVVRVRKVRASASELLIPASEARAIRVLMEKQLGPMPANLADSLRMQESPVPQIAIKPIETPVPIAVEPVYMPPAISEEGV
jgi:hypothetical protein